jgi:hypothetical protein
MIMVDARNRFAGDLEDNRWPSPAAQELCVPAAER